MVLRYAHLSVASLSWHILMLHPLLWSIILTIIFTVSVSKANCFWCSSQAKELAFIAPGKWEPKQKCTQTHLPPKVSLPAPCHVALHTLHTCPAVAAISTFVCRASVLQRWIKVVSAEFKGRRHCAKHLRMKIVLSIFHIESLVCKTIQLAVMLLWWNSTTSLPEFKVHGNFISLKFFSMYVVYVQQSLAQHGKQWDAC